MISNRGSLIKAEQESLKQVTSEEAEFSEKEAINRPEAGP